MSQDLVLAALSDKPATQKELSSLLHIGAGVLSHRLNSLLKKGLVERHVLERRYRPFGYVKRPGYEAGSEKMRWPKYESV